MVGDVRMSACCSAPFETVEDRQETHGGRGEVWHTVYVCASCSNPCAVKWPGSDFAQWGGNGMSGEAMLDALDAIGSGWVREAIEDRDES